MEDPGRSPELYSLGVPMLMSNLKERVQWVVKLASKLVLYSEGW